MIARINRHEAIKLLKERLAGSSVEEDSTKILCYNLACYECLEGNLDEAKRIIKEHLSLHPERKAIALDDIDFSVIKSFIANITTS